MEVNLDASDLWTGCIESLFLFRISRMFFPILHSILDHWLVVSFFFCDLFFFPTTASNFVFSNHTPANWLIWVTS